MDGVSILTQCQLIFTPCCFDGFSILVDIRVDIVQNKSFGCACEDCYNLNNGLSTCLVYGMLNTRVNMLF